MTCKRFVMNHVILKLSFVQAWGFVNILHLVVKPYCRVLNFICASDLTSDLFSGSVLGQPAPPEVPSWQPLQPAPPVPLQRPSLQSAFEDNRAFLKSTKCVQPTDDSFAPAFSFRYGLHAKLSRSPRTTSIQQAVWSISAVRELTSWALLLREWRL